MKLKGFLHLKNIMKQKTVYSGSHLDIGYEIQNWKREDLEGYEKKIIGRFISTSI